ncbi:hypothetical protein ACKLNO_10455 [Neisseriaceae bacterium B1]
MKTTGNANITIFRQPEKAQSEMKGCLKQRSVCGTSHARVLQNIQY